jgi:hypothetical protein
MNPAGSGRAGWHLRGHSFQNEWHPEMSASLHLFAELSDAELLERVVTLAHRERAFTVQLVGALAELDRRKLYLAQGCSSLFVYCTRVLHLSEHEAYNRIEVARAAMRFPTILDRLESGSVNLTAVRLLAPLLTVENHEQVLDKARHKARREVESLIAALRPQPDAPTMVRRLPNPTTEAVNAEPSRQDESERAPTPIRASPAPSAPPVTVALAPDRYKIQFTASREFHDKLRRAQALLRHAVPTGDLGEIIGRALDLLLPRLEVRKTGMTTRPRTNASRPTKTRHIPAAVKREVWKRDNGRCAYVGAQGRCGEHTFLEYHHILSFAYGGAATTANIELRCRAHNAYEADRVFKPMFVE